jgi:hypothetical protein
MRRKKLKVSTIQPAVEVFAGFLGGKTVSTQLNKIPQVQANPVIGAVAKAGAGVFLLTQRNKSVKNMGLGVLASALNDAYDQYVAPALGGASSGSVAGSARMRSIAGASRNYMKDGNFETHKVAGGRYTTAANGDVITD